MIIIIMWHILIMYIIKYETYSCTLLYSWNMWICLVFNSITFIPKFQICIVFYVCSITVISGAGIYRQTCESVFSPSKFKANVSFIAFGDCCSFVEIEPKWLHSILVLKRPAVKNIDEQLCKKVSFTLSVLIWTLRNKIKEID